MDPIPQIPHPPALLAHPPTAPRGRWTVRIGERSERVQPADGTSVRYAARWLGVGVDQLHEALRTAGYAPAAAETSLPRPDADACAIALARAAYSLWRDGPSTAVIQLGQRRPGWIELQGADSALAPAKAGPVTEPWRALVRALGLPAALAELEAAGSALVPGVRCQVRTHGRAAALRFRARVDPQRARGDYPALPEPAQAPAHAS